jgi:hypothetical protein
MIYSLFKLKIFFYSLVISSTLLVAKETQSKTTQETLPAYCSEALVEIKTGYFCFSDSTMRKVYDRGGFDIQLCASYPLRKLSSRWTLNAYSALEYFQRSGHSINGSEKTSLWSIPVNIGFKPTYALSPKAQYYFTIGPRYFYMHQHNDSCFFDKNKSGSGLGGFINTGFNHKLSGHFLIDIFAEYSYARMNRYSKKAEVYTESTQVGGFTLGAGFSCKF